MGAARPAPPKNMPDLNDLNIEYRVSPRRKSIGIMVTTAGNVVVTLPRGASKESLAQALRSTGPGSRPRWRNDKRPGGA